MVNLITHIYMYVKHICTISIAETDNVIRCSDEKEMYFLQPLEGFDERR